MKYRDGESNPDLRVEGPASFPLNDRGSSSSRIASSCPTERKGWDSHPHRSEDRYPPSKRAPHLAGSLPRQGPSVGLEPTASSLPKKCSHQLSYKGTASPARIERATPAFGGRCSVH